MKTIGYNGVLTIFRHTHIAVSPFHCTENDQFSNLAFHVVFLDIGCICMSWFNPSCQHPMLLTHFPSDAPVQPTVSKTSVNTPGNRPFPRCVHLWWISPRNMLVFDFQVWFPEGKPTCGGNHLDSSGLHIIFSLNSQFFLT